MGTADSCSVCMHFMALDRLESGSLLGMCIHAHKGHPGNWADRLITPTNKVCEHYAKRVALPVHATPAEGDFTVR